eukprot:COSAG01_NODE_63446_length_280_cov_0.569061_1_plen_31_part_01
MVLIKRLMQLWLFIVCLAAAMPRHVHANSIV